MTVKIDSEKCGWKDGKCTCGCCAESKCCTDVCPVDAIKRDKTAVVDADTCIDCGACIETCPKDAISF
ncbi:4Fe-4S binding protein [Candidatus Woesearchaeota archaeon]|jgi:NAD-dependent dihydropyrimidine dehydrogenase PreA subunit|nr:4Fe-4S binding protein [Candidatus Woesearchaeota archaeon]MBT4368339.1 4Fe-4S binding protein [Candidatus Woesearchaeota archaeon]MBT4712828.1 4Fe-4S binding protein [Candidatus Woesearchaeota archaeon]MBT6639740.1 4Fe-4S binding protein [Candidatus Woesearchaeota archaeon]MBT7133912.1 4Fe-4S binding protein [Candidatus Woesearchaeota archaeon]